MSGKELYACKPFECKLVNLHNKSRIPLPLNDHLVCTNDRYLFSFGGYSYTRDSEEFPPTNYPSFIGLWCFNFATRRWAKILDNERKNPITFYPTMMLAQGNILLICGHNAPANEDDFQTDIYIADVSDPDARLRFYLTSGDAPRVLYKPSMFERDGYIYTVGGTNQIQHFCDIHRLKISTLVWEAVYVADEADGDERRGPDGRYEHFTALWEDEIFLIGGRMSREVGFEFIPIFNLTTKKWSMGHAEPAYNEFLLLGSGVPSHRYFNSAVQHDSYVYISGGRDSNVLYFDLWRLDLHTLHWDVITGHFLRVPVYHQAAVATSFGKMYLFGGVDGNNPSSYPSLSPTNYLFSTWLGVPKLIEMAWEALLYYSGDTIEEHAPKALLEMGVPKRYVQRIHGTTGNDLAIFAQDRQPLRYMQPQPPLVHLMPELMAGGYPRFGYPEYAALDQVLLVVGPGMLQLYEYRYIAYQEYLGNIFRPRNHEPYPQAIGQFNRPGVLPNYHYGNAVWCMNCNAYH